jgi:hypothetical protein
MDRSSPRLPRGATLMMYRNRQSSLRCPEHDLALGPGGECVLCRRGRARPPQRWLGPALGAASLATLLLGGVALARTRAPSPVRATPEMVGMEPVSAAVPVESRPTLAAAPLFEVHPSPPPTPLAPGAPAPPPRNYLDEAYAAMPKGQLYDEAPPATTVRSSTCACRKHGCQSSFVYGTYRPHHAPHPATPQVVVDVQQPAPIPVATYGRAGGSFSRGAGVRR